MQSSVLFAIWDIVMLAIILWLMFDNLKRTDKLIDEYEEALKRELALTIQKGNLMEIIINSKATKENFHVTFAKIEKELFK